MQWPRVKTLLIVLMLFVNLILLSVFLLRHENARSVSDNGVNDLVAVLESRGVSIARETVPDDSARAYVLEAVRDEAFEREIADFLLPGAAAQDQGGNIYVYEDENGRATFRGGGNMEISLDRPYQAEKTGKIEETALKLLSRMGFNVTGAETSAVRTDTGASVSVRQSVSGFPVFDCSVELLFDGDLALTGLTGRWISGAPAQADTKASKSAAFALLNFTDAMSKAGTPVKSIQAVEPGYLTGAIAPGYLRLLPVWRVVTDEAEYYVSAMTGELEIAS